MGLCEANIRFKLDPWRYFTLKLLKNIYWRRDNILGPCPLNEKLSCYEGKEKTY